MRIPLDKKSYLGYGALAILLIVGTTSLFFVAQFIEVSNRLARTGQFIFRLQNISGLVSEVESAERGYVLSGNEALLSPYKNAAAAVHQEIRNAASLVRDNAAQINRLEKLQSLITQRFNDSKKITDTRRSLGMEAARKFSASGQNVELGEKIRSALRQIRESAVFVLNSQSARGKDSAQGALHFLILEIIAALIFTAAPILILYGDIDARRRVEEKFKEASKKLQVWVDDLEQRNSEFAVLSETADLLHTCVSAQEAYGVLSRSCQKLFPDMQGALYLINEERNLVEAVSEWNGPIAGESVFHSDDCWALRRGRIYEAESPSGRVICGHLAGVSFDGYLCVPMMGQGAALGFLHFRYSKGAHKIKEGPRAIGSISDTKKKLVTTFAEQAALALANLRLRETLRRQSIRDPLTGLYNRRYMEESLERELRRAARSKKPLSTLMVDIDHFKKFNDLFGHETGDELLMQVSQHIQRHIREYDVPCRYGGEEFLILMPETSLETAQKRAENLRKSVKSLQLQNKGRPIGPISLSVGVAAFPSHAQTPENLFRAADTALYRAKSEGRDRVFIADSI